MDTAYVPLDSCAVAAGADQVAVALSACGATVRRNGSRGLAWAEPLLELATEQSRLAFRNVAAADVPTILEQREAHPTCLGEVGEIDFLRPQTRTIFDRAGTAHPLELAKTTVLRQCLRQDPQRLIDEVEAAGLRGRGGAGFPATSSGARWPIPRLSRRYVVCNADEGDSGTFADRLLMEGDPYRLIEGMTIAGLATGATKGYVYLRSEYPIAADIFQAALDAVYADGVLGTNILGSGKSASTSSYSSAPAPISAARKHRCSRASKASAAKSAPSRRCRPSPACSASQRWYTT